MQTIFSVFGFWTYKSNEIVWSVFQIHKLAEYPIDIYNKFIRIVITLVFPFAFASYYPTMNYLGSMTDSLIIIVLIVAVIIWIVAIKTWNWGLRKYRSTGT